MSVSVIAVTEGSPEFYSVNGSNHIINLPELPAGACRAPWSASLLGDYRAICILFKGVCGRYPAFPGSTGSAYLSNVLATDQHPNKITVKWKILEV